MSLSASTPPIAGREIRTRLEAEQQGAVITAPAPAFGSATPWGVLPIPGMQRPPPLTYPDTNASYLFGR